MTNTGVGETNITLYNGRYRPLTRKEFLERYEAVGAGAFYTCVHDMLLFAKRWKRLVHPNRMKLLDFCRDMPDGTVKIAHRGTIYGGTSTVSMVYSQDWKFVSMKLKFLAIN